jgi:hypothetical protein
MPLVIESINTLVVTNYVVSTSLDASLDKLRRLVKSLESMSVHTRIALVFELASLKCMFLTKLCPTCTVELNMFVKATCLRCTNRKRNDLAEFYKKVAVSTPLSVSSIQLAIALAALYSNCPRLRYATLPLRFFSRHIKEIRPKMLWDIGFWRE